MGCNHCEEFSRSHLVRRAVAEAGTGPTGDRARMPAPREPASAGARSCCARAPRCCPSTAPRSCALGDLEAGIAQAAGGQRAGPGLDLPRRRDRLAVGALADHRLDIPGAAPEPGAAGRRRNGVHRGPAPALEPHRRGASTPCTGGQDVGAAGGRLLEPRPVALHLAPLLGGRRPAAERGHRLDGPPDRPDRHPRQPAAGTFARRLALAGAGHRRGARRGDRGHSTIWAQGVGASRRS